MSSKVDPTPPRSSHTRQAVLDATAALLSEGGLATPDRRYPRSPNGRP